MFIFEDLIIMYSSPLMICFVQYHTFTVYHVLRLYSMFFLFTGVVAFLLSLVLRPWYFLFSRIYESRETRKVLFNFFYSFKLSDTFIQFLGSGIHSLTSGSNMRMKLRCEFVAL